MREDGPPRPGPVPFLGRRRACGKRCGGPPPGRGARVGERRCTPAPGVLGGRQQRAPQRCLGVGAGAHHRHQGEREQGAAGHVHHRGGQHRGLRVQVGAHARVVRERVQRPAPERVEQPAQRPGPPGGGDGEGDHGQGEQGVAGVGGQSGQERGGGVHGVDATPGGGAGPGRHRGIRETPVPSRTPVRATPCRRTRKPTMPVIQPTASREPDSALARQRARRGCSRSPRARWPR